MEADRRRQSTLVQCSPTDGSGAEVERRTAHERQSSRTITKKPVPSLQSRCISAGGAHMFLRDLTRVSCIRGGGLADECKVLPVYSQTASLESRTCLRSSLFIN